MYSCQIPISPNSLRAKRPNRAAGNISKSTAFDCFRSGFALHMELYPRRVSGRKPYPSGTKLIAILQDSSTKGRQPPLELEERGAGRKLFGGPDLISFGGEDTGKDERGRWRLSLRIDPISFGHQLRILWLLTVWPRAILGLFPDPLQ